MDTAINRPFKSRVRESYLSWRGHQVGKNEPWRAPSRKEVIEWVLGTWECLPIELFHKAMCKHVLDPAQTVPSAPVVAPPPDPAAPPEQNADQHLNALSDLPLPPEALGDGSGEDLAGESDGSKNSQSDSDGSADIPEICLKCDRPMRGANRAQCPKCSVWLHKSCMSSSSDGRCPFCP